MHLCPEGENCGPQVEIAEGNGQQPEFFNFPKCILIPELFTNVETVYIFQLLFSLFAK